MSAIIGYINELLGDRTGHTTLILGSGFAAILIAYWIKSYIDKVNYFKRLNIPGPTPLPVFGNAFGIMQNGLMQYDTLLIKTYGSTCGLHEASTPVILTTDVKFIKNILVKDFSSFVNHRVFDALMLDPLDKFILVLKDDEWKNVRSLMSTSFTSGKLKSMSKCMMKCVKNYEKYLQDLVEKDNSLETKKFFSDYSFDVISSCFFGMDLNTINDPDNVFLKNLQSIMASFLGFKLKLHFLAPGIMGFLNKQGLIEIFPMRTFKFLEDVVNTVIQRRKEKLDVRDDFIQYMIEHEQNPETTTKEETEDEKKTTAWNGPLKKTLTTKELLSQSIFFLTAGHDTTTTAFEFLTYSLAMNQDVQTKLIAEIDHVLEQHNGEINYDSIHDMKYMDMVIDETLRMYPPAPRLDRVASNDYEYEGIRIKKGQVMSIPIYALHHDATVYPEPERFMPERFDEAHKKTRDNAAFLGFGIGPRSCLGMRFAFVSVKLLLSTILSKYRFEKCDKTPEKIIFLKTTIARSANPIYVKIEKRN